MVEEVQMVLCLPAVYVCCCGVRDDLVNDLPIYADLLIGRTPALESCQWLVML